MATVFGIKDLKIVVFELFIGHFA
ncbi:hypothetical protein KAOT1_18052 [Kordia algicida OT-1]|uniref:Uncharacterized protein n=1 Tax=Kordia algicida OT-1 TaxID=391587 RepID=A9DN12_9FLAO|nr:hypothetical protein KAOT1_18052 [Kordia algicida OT-1]